MIAISGLGCSARKRRDFCEPHLLTFEQKFKGGFRGVLREAEGPWGAPESSLSIPAGWGGGHRGNCLLLGGGGGSDRGFLGHKQSQEGGKGVPVLSPAFPRFKGARLALQTLWGAIKQPPVPTSISTSRRAWRQPRSERSLVGFESQFSEEKK